MNDYATTTYVDGKFNFVNNQLTDIKSKDYATKESVDKVSKDLSEYRSHVSNVFNDHWGHIEWIMEDWAKIEYVDQKIAEAQLGGGEGGSVDLSQYATKEYVDGAIADIEIPDVDLSDYATNDSVDEKIAAIELTPGPKGEKGEKGDKGDQGEPGPAPDLTVYATKEELNNALGDIETLLGEI
jgi:hypothetical protein